MVRDGTRSPDISQKLSGTSCHLGMMQMDLFWLFSKARTQFSVSILLLCMASCERGVVTRQVVFSPPGYKKFKCSQAFGTLKAGGSQYPRGGRAKIVCNMLQVSRGDVFSKYSFPHALCPLTLQQVLHSCCPNPALGYLLGLIHQVTSQPVCLLGMQAKVSFSF